jgi:hypothetical protein
MPATRQAFVHRTRGWFGVSAVIAPFEQNELTGNKIAETAPQAPR